MGHAPGLGSPAWPLSLWLPLRGPWEAGRPLGPSADLGSGWASSPQTFLSPRPCCDVCGGSVGGWGGVGRARHGLRFLAACRSDAIRSLCPRAGRQLPPAPLLAAEDGASTWCTNLRKGPRAWEPLLRLGGSSAHLHPPAQRWRGVLARCPHGCRVLESVGLGPREKPGFSGPVRAVSAAVGQEPAGRLLRRAPTAAGSPSLAWDCV